jgi:pyruvate dehydrogenase E1 component alpha subunit
MYSEMLRIRMVEEAIAELYSEHEMRCPVHLCVGQEAVAVGVCATLTRNDYVLSAHRSHGHYLAKGGDLRGMLAEIYGRVTGCCLGRGGSMHLVDLKVGFLGAAPIVASTIPIATGCAFGTKMLGDRRVTVVFFGDGATEEGVFHEAINFASLHRSPIVFVCENNGYSVESPLQVRQPPGRRITDLTAGHGIPSFRGNGNDAEAVYNLTASAVQRASNGEGPTVLEFITKRWREHCGPQRDAPDAVTWNRWQSECPIELLKNRLQQMGKLSTAEHTRTVETLQAEISEAFAFAKSSPFPEPEHLPEVLYAR